MNKPFGDAGDARFMPRGPFEEDGASLRRQLATRPEFSDISRMSDAQVRAHVAELRSTGRLPPQHEYTPTQQAHATVTVEMAMPAKEQDETPVLVTVEKEQEVVKPWKLSVCVKSRYPKFPLIGKIKVAVYEKQDHSGQPKSVELEFKSSDKSTVETTLTGDDESTYYLAAKGTLEREFPPVRHEYGQEEWASNEDMKVKMNPGEDQTVEIIIDPPQSVEVKGGYFWGYRYAAIDDRKKGAAIVLVFQAKDDQGNDGQTMSLVQTVKDTSKLTDPQGNVDITPTPTTSQLGNRQLALHDVGVEADDVKTGIDQEVLDDAGRNVINLDFRYSEKRTSEAGNLNVAGNTANEERTVRSAKKAGGKWSAAVLNDEPGPTTNITGVRYNVRHGVVTGAMEFEVAAFNNDTNEFLGSVKWGWKMQGGYAVPEPPTLTVANANSATKRFFRAAGKWNRTKIVEPGTGREHDPMQIPIP